MRVKDLMSVRVATVAPDESLHVADGIMSLGGVRHLPVLSGGQLVGLISQRDILRAPGLLSSPCSSTKDVLRALRVEDAMSREVVSIGAEMSIAQAAERLLQHRVGCLPVVGAAGALVGIVTTSDLLRAIAGPPDPVNATSGASALSPAIPARAEAAA